MRDLLAGSSNGSGLLFPAPEILTTNPVTLLDLRKIVEVAISSGSHAHTVHEAVGRVMRSVLGPAVDLVRLAQEHEPAGERS